MLVGGISGFSAWNWDTSIHSFEAQGSKQLYLTSLLSCMPSVPDWNGCAVYMNDFLKLFDRGKWKIGSAVGTYVWSKWREKKGGGLEWRRTNNGFFFCTGGTIQAPAVRFQVWMAHNIIIMLYKLGNIYFPALYLTSRLPRRAGGTQQGGDMTTSILPYAWSNSNEWMSEWTKEISIRRILILLLLCNISGESWRKRMCLCLEMDACTSARETMQNAITMCSVSFETIFSLVRRDTP